MLGDTQFGPTTECLPNISRSGPTSERLPNVSLPVQTSPHDMFLHIVDRHSSPFGPTSECLPNIPEHLPKSGPTSLFVSSPCSFPYLYYPLSFFLFFIFLPFLIGVIPLFIYFPLTPHWVYILSHPSRDPYPCLLGSPAKGILCTVLLAIYCVDGPC